MERLLIASFPRENTKHIQVQLFSKTRLLVGDHGAGLSNMVYVLDLLDHSLRLSSTPGVSSILPCFTQQPLSTFSSIRSLPPSSLLLPQPLFRSVSIDPMWPLPLSLPSSGCGCQARCICCGTSKVLTVSSGSTGLCPREPQSLSCGTWVVTISAPSLRSSTCTTTESTGIKAIQGLSRQRRHTLQHCERPSTLPCNPLLL